MVVSCVTVDSSGSRSRIGSSGRSKRAVGRGWSPGVLRSGGRTPLRARSFDGPRRSANLDCLEAQQARGSNDQRNTETSASQRAGATTGGGAAGQAAMNKSGVLGNRARGQRYGLAVAG